MANETELACVSCDSQFDPEPNGGFCPDCDTPHPDYNRPDAVDEQSTEGESPADSQDAELESPETDEEGEASAVETEDADGDTEPADEEPDTADGDVESDDVTPVGEDESESEPESETPVGESESDSETPVGESESETGDASRDEETADEDSEPVEAAEIEDVEDAEVEALEDDAASDEVEAVEAAETDDADGETVEANADTPQADAEEAGDVECRSCGSAVAASASFCPNCGTEVGTEDEAESTALDACPDCEHPVTDESFCPNCGTDLDAARESAGAADESPDTADAEPEGITLVVGDGTYSFGDGDTFGRQDEAWLSDLVTASGGRDEASYVSGDHLRFEVEDDGVYVTDLGRNGTLLDGEDLDGGRAKLDGGETLTLAERAEIGVRL